MARGLKPVKARRDDALAREAWDRLESLLCDYYRRQGYDVEHCGTGGRSTRFDGGVDLRLRRGLETIVVQCKHWNAYQVPHNDVHQLLGIMVNEGASGAILVTSGEFTKAAIEAAGRHGHVELVDGDDLREMLGPQILETGSRSGDAGEYGRWAPGRTFGDYAAERLIAAEGGRARGSGKRRERSDIASAAWAGLISILPKLTVALALLYFGSLYLQRVIRDMAPTQPAAAQVSQPPRSAAPPAQAALQREALPPVVYEPSPRDLEAWRRGNAESMEILRESTPELPADPRTQDVWQTR